MSSWPSESEVFAIFKDGGIGVFFVLFLASVHYFADRYAFYLSKGNSFFSCFPLLHCVRVLFIFSSSQVSSAYLMLGGSLFPLRNNKTKNKTTFTQGTKDHPLIK